MIITYDAAVRPSETQYVTDIAESIMLLNERFNLNFSDLRFARKSKSFGSSGVAPMHFYTYPRTGKKEVWINLAYEHPITAEEIAFKMAEHSLSQNGAELNHKDCTQELLAKYDPENKYKHNKAFKLHCLRKEGVRSSEILKKMKGVVSARKLIEIAAQ